MCIYIYRSVDILILRKFRYILTMRGNTWIKHNHKCICFFSSIIVIEKISTTLIQKKKRLIFIIIEWNFTYIDVLYRTFKNIRVCIRFEFFGVFLSSLSAEETINLFWCITIIIIYLVIHCRLRCIRFFKNNYHYSSNALVLY